MSRLSDEQIKEAILHPDANVRFAAVQYFSDCNISDPSIMLVAIEAFERFGRTRAFLHCPPIVNLTQTESTIRWAVEELKSQPRHTESEGTYLHYMSRLLVKADPRLVQPFEKDILAAPGFEPELGDRLARRLKMSGWGEEALWRELDAICDEGKNETYTGDIRWNEAKDTVEELGRRGDGSSARILEVLEQEDKDYGEYENTSLFWKAPLMAKLAGELQFRPAIPLIVDMLHIDDEVMNGECIEALVKYGSNDVIRAVHGDYPTAEWHFRLYASTVLGGIHTDLAVEVLIELLSHERDGDLHNFLAQALVAHYSTEGNEVARKVLLQHPRRSDLRTQLLTACTLMGQDFPELTHWRREIEEEKKERKEFARQFRLPSQPLPSQRPQSQRPAAAPKPAAPMPRLEKQVGRNDPCPCGSGKKFKKCCLNK